MDFSPVNKSLAEHEQWMYGFPVQKPMFVASKECAPPPTVLLAKPSLFLHAGHMWVVLNMTITKMPQPSTVLQTSSSFNLNAVHYWADFVKRREVLLKECVGAPAPFKRRSSCGTRYCFVARTPLNAQQLL
jgi:hypothetical protein